MAGNGKSERRDAMMHTPALVHQGKRQEILDLAQQHGAFNVRVFGSVAKGQATGTSDLDLLVDFEPDRSLLDRIALIQDLEDILGIPVDVVTEEALHPLIREEILNQAHPL